MEAMEEMVEKSLFKVFSFKLVFNKFL